MPHVNLNDGPVAAGRRTRLMNQKTELQAQTTVLALQNRCETAGSFLCQRKNADGSVSLTVAEVDQLLMILGA